MNTNKKNLTIVGAGPGGLLLSIMFSDKYHITLIEKQNKIGGCWRIDWKNGLFTEHSPKVGSGKYYEKLMKYLDVELVKTYNQPIIDFTLLFLFSFSFFDWVYFTLYYVLIKLKLLNKQIYVSEWMQSFSKNARNVIKQISILIADIPEKVLLEDYMNSFSSTTFYQLKDPEEWLNKLQMLIKNKNVEIVLNTEIESFSKYFSRTIDNRIIYHDYFISTVPPNALINILKNCSKDVKYNWGNIEPILHKSFYSSIGFQLHYTSKIPDVFKKPLAINSNIVVLIHTSKYTKNFTKKKNIVDTLSCTIINQKTTIPEAVEKITEIVKLSPYIITVNDVKYDNNNIAISEDTAFTRQKAGIIPFKGKNKNLFLVNSFNEKDISSLDKTIRICYHFRNKKLL